MAWASSAIIEINVCIVYHRCIHYRKAPMASLTIRNLDPTIKERPARSRC